MVEESAKPVEMFYSYAAQDEDLQQELEKHLSILKRKKLVSTWHFRKIYAGMERVREADAHLNMAHIILLLVSADFIASDYCYEVEVGRAMERHEAGEACVIPILLRPVVWDGTPFSKLQALPAGGNPVTTWTNLDSAFYDITLGIQIAARDISKRFLPAYADQLTHKTIKDYPYDFAFSYASEDRIYAEALANSLRQHGAKVFCYSQDINHKMRLFLWGKSLDVYLFDVYQKRSRYCIVFLSRNYAAKRWTSREKEAVLARALKEQEYLFPIRLDETEIPGIPIDIAYTWWHDHAVEDFAEVLAEKLKTVSHVVP